MNIINANGCSFSESEHGENMHTVRNYTYDLTNLQILMLIDGDAEITCANYKVPDSPTFMIGDKVTLTCTVRNVSDRIANELTYQWFRKGSDTSTEDMLEKTGKVIKLPLLTLKDNGSYQCVVTCEKLGEWTIKSNLLIMEVIGELSTYNTARLAEISTGILLAYFTHARNNSYSINSLNL